MNEIPFVAFGNGELDGNEPIGETVECPNCGEIHKVEYGNKVNEDGTLSPSKMLAFIKCDKNEKHYLVGISGKRI